MGGRRGGAFCNVSKPRPLYPPIKFLTCALEGFSLDACVRPRVSCASRGALRLWVWTPSGYRRSDRNGTSGLSASFFFLASSLPSSHFFPPPAPLFCLVSPFLPRPTPAGVSLAGEKEPSLPRNRGGVGSTVNWGIWRPYWRWNVLFVIRGRARVVGRGLSRRLAGTVLNWICGCGDAPLNG